MTEQTLPDRNIFARITLTQKGKEGPISPNIEFAPRNDKEVPASHEAMSQLVALYLQLQTFLNPDETVDPEATEYNASFTLSQDEIDGPVFSNLLLAPRVTANDPTFPSSYEIASYIATAWLQMCGVIDGKGDLVDEDALEFQAFDAKERQVH